MLKFLYEKNPNWFPDINFKSLRRGPNLQKLTNFTLKEKVENFNLSIIKSNIKLSVGIFDLFSKRLLKCGKKQAAETIFFKVLNGLRVKGFENPLRLVIDTLLFLKPAANVTVLKRGRKTITIPYLVNYKTEVPTAVRWIIKNAKNRADKGIVSKLISEFSDIYNQKGASVQKKIDLQKLVSLNIKSLYFMKPRFRKKIFSSIPRKRLDK